MAETEGVPKVPKEIVQIASSLDCDVILYNGMLKKRHFLSFLSLFTSRSLSNDVLLILVTEGGNPDVAYRIARYLQAKYQKVRLFVSGFCKSAGTLVALGAHELVISDLGELGPLDVQMQKKDEMWEWRSGLIHHFALSVLQDHARQTFESLFVRMKRGAGGITLRTAAELAIQVTTGLLEPLYRQIEPLRVTEAIRAIRIAHEYGERLLKEGGNLKVSMLDKLISGYPSHSFSIDRQEARELFERVREPTEKERELVMQLGVHAYEPLHTNHHLICFLSPENRGGSSNVKDKQPTTGKSNASHDRRSSTKIDEAQHGSPQKVNSK